MDDAISRQAAIDAVEESRRLNHHENGKEACAHEYEHRHFLKILRDLPTVEPQIIRCRDCKYWNNGSCECREHAVNCQDYMVGDIETEAEHFCGYAERREVTT